jgi:cystathionine beta-lyase
MAMQHGLNRRTFLRSAGLAALAGSVVQRSSLAATIAPQGVAGPRYDFDEAYARIGTDCIKWDRQIQRFGAGTIAAGMGIADMDFRAAPCVTAALAKRCRHENWGYLAMPSSYAEAIAAWDKRRHGLDVDPASIVLTTSVHTGLIAALHAFAPPGSRVLLTTPTYNGFYGDLRYTHTIPDDSPMKVIDGRYAIDFEDFERRASRASAFILCNPQNPTGNCWTPDELTRMGEICLRHRVVVLADEIHCDLIRKGHTHTAFASLPSRDIVNNSLTFNAASKTFSLSGLKAAWFFSTNPDYLARVTAHHRADLSTLGMVATRAVLTEGDDWLDQLLPYLDGNHALVSAYVKDRMPLVTCTNAEGTYLAWLDVSAVIDRIGAAQRAAEESRSSREPVTAETIVERWFVEHAKVHLNAGSTYGTGGAGHMRMNLGTSRKLIQVALDNMATALREL